MKLRNRTVTQGFDQQAREGVRKNLTGMSTLYLGTRQFTPTELEDFIQARIDAATRVIQAKAAWVQAARAYVALDHETSVVLADLKRFVMGAFGPQSPRLADFGFAAPKVVTLTEAQKKEAVAKRAATRKARGTLGPKAKLAIKGTPPTGAPPAMPVP